MATPGAAVDAAAKQPILSRSSSRIRLKRSLSEFASPAKLHRRPHLLRRQDSQNDEGERRPLSPAILAVQARDLPDKAATSANTPFISPNVSRTASRTASLRMPKDTSEGHAAPAGEMREARRRAQDCQEASVWAEGLKQSLAYLNSFSSTMTKRLDDTYYSALGNMSDLQNIGVALQDLAERSDKLGKSFDKDARDIEKDVIRQLSVADQFQEQRSRIAGLQQRLHAHREDFARLKSRVDVVGDRVKRWELADNQWQEKTRRRLKIIWSIVFAVALIVVASLVALNKVDGESSARSAISPNIPPWLNSSGAIGLDESDEESGRRLLWKESYTDAEQLRAFDEL